MSKTLWIGDVQDNWTEDYLFKLLQNASKLFVIIIIDRGFSICEINEKPCDKRTRR